MSSGAPDPSQPNAMDARIRQIVFDILKDPISFPDEMTNWLTTFVSLNPGDSTGTKVTQSPHQP
jgi:hypothetical protein